MFRAAPYVIALLSAVPVTSLVQLALPALGLYAHRGFIVASMVNLPRGPRHATAAFSTYASARVYGAHRLQNSGIVANSRRQPPLALFRKCLPDSILVVYLQNEVASLE